MRPPFILGIGGSTSASSSTESALVLALEGAARAGARTQLVGGDELARLPYGVHDQRAAAVKTFLEKVRQADGVIIASPGYHGSVSGLVKNALDHIADTRKDARPYLDGVPVGLIGTGGGWQGAVTALSSLRTIVHAVRGWPTPLGVSIKSSSGLFRDGVCADAATVEQLFQLGGQVVDFVKLRTESFALSG